MTKKLKGIVYILLILVLIELCLTISSIDVSAKQLNKTFTATLKNNKRKYYNFKLSNAAKVKITVKMKDVVLDENYIPDEDGFWVKENHSAVLAINKVNKDWEDTISDGQIYYTKEYSTIKSLKKGRYSIIFELTDIIYGSAIKCCRYEITVKDISKYTKKIQLNKNAVSLYVGKVKTIKAKPQKKGYMIKRGVIWSSSNSKIAEVSSDGKIKGVSKGTCYIYAKVKGGGKKKCKVTVKQLADFNVSDGLFRVDMFGGIMPTLWIENNTSKTVKYAYVAVSVDGNRKQLKIGRIKPYKEENVNFGVIMYKKSAYTMKVLKATVAYTDGTIKTYNINKSFSRQLEF